MQQHKRKWDRWLTQQRKTYRLYNVSQRLPKQNKVSVIPHVGVFQSTCLCRLTEHNKHVLQRRVMTENTGVLWKWEGKSHLEELLSVACLFSPHQASRVCAGHTKHTHQKPAVIAQQQQDLQLMPWWRWELIQNCDGMISPLLRKHTSVRWHTSTDSTEEMLVMNVLTVLHTDFTSWCASGLIHGYT